MNARKIISLFLAIVFAVTTFATPVFASGDKAMAKKLLKPGKKQEVKYNKGKHKFTDSDEVEWATKAIEKLGLEGILSGKNGSQYKPKENVSELEALAMILNLAGDKAAAAKYNSKVHPLYKGAKPSWGLGYLFLAIEKEIILPEELKGFNPNTPVKRHEVAKYLVRALGKTEEANKHMDEDLDYEDASSIPEKSVGYVYVATDMGLMKGNNNGEFQPMKPITRAEMAVILDNVDGNNGTTDTVNNRTTFVSYNDSTDKITVKKDGKSYTYVVLSDTPVYVDGKYSSLSALKEGDVIELIFNTSRQVIFIEVTRLNSDTNNTGLGSSVTATAVSYNNLPDAIQDEVDSLKDDENYKAFRYDGYIYLIAAMGEKQSGGYDIDIEKVYKYKNSDNDYTLNVKVSTDSPSSSDIVTQSITYPYDVVRISYFSGIDEVRFLDEDNDKLEETAVSNEYYDSNDTELGDELSVSNMDYEDLPEVIQDRVDDLKDNENYKAYKYDGYIYLIATRGEKSTGGYDIDIEKVYRYEASDDDYILNVKLELDDPSSTGSVSQSHTYPYDVARIKYFSGIDKVRFLDEDDDKLGETTVYQQDEEETVSGTVKSVNTSTRIVEVVTSSGRTTKYIISSSTPITVNDDEAEFSDIVKNMTIKLTVADSKVTSVDAEDTVENYTGILTGISISTDKIITVKIGSSYKSYTLTSGTEIYINNTKEDINDLRINDELALKLVNGALTEITVK